MRYTGIKVTTESVARRYANLTMTYDSMSEIIGYTEYGIIPYIKKYADLSSTNEYANILILDLSAIDLNTLSVNVYETVGYVEYGITTSDLYKVLEGMYSGEIFKTLTRNVLKALSKSTIKDALTMTIDDIISKGFTDDCMEDLQHEIAVAWYTYTKGVDNIFICSNLRTGKLSCRYGTFEVEDTRKGHIGETVERHGMKVFCSVIRKWFQDNKSPRVDLVPDVYANDYDEEEEDEITYASPRSHEYVELISDHLKSVKSIGYFVQWLPTYKDGKNKTLPVSLQMELSIMAAHLANGTKANRASQLMGIDERRGYWLVKKLHDLYTVYEGIERKSVEFIKTSYTDYVDGEEVEKPCYKRIVSEKATIEVLGKKHKTTIISEPTYTEDKGFTIDVKNRKAEKLIVTHGGQALTLPEGTRVKRYVINKSKFPMSDQDDGCTYRRSDSTASGSYTFSYGDILYGYIPPIDRSGEELTKSSHDRKQALYEELFKQIDERDKEIQDAENRIQKESGRLEYRKENGYVIVSRNGEDIERYRIIKA